MTAEGRILESGRIEAPIGQIRYLILPDQDLFSHRAGRFRYLAKGHPLEDYLAFLAHLADAQQAARDSFPIMLLPDHKEQADGRNHGSPLLDAQTWRRSPTWREGLAVILQHLGAAKLPPVARDTITSLMQASDTSLEEMADKILAGDLTDVSPQELPFLAAALQVYWVQIAASLGEDAFGQLEERGLCPVCRSLPNVGIVRSGGAEQGLRYLHCSLCAAQWHMVRITCSSCEATDGINHYTLEGSNGAVKAESCDDCNTYLKLLYLGKDKQMDAMVDDLATLALDMLMDQEGKSRGGPNLFFHPGRL